jgi:hypothetical protein
MRDHGGRESCRDRAGVKVLDIMLPVIIAEFPLDNFCNSSLYPGHDIPGPINCPGNFPGTMSAGSSGFRAYGIHQDPPSISERQRVLSVFEQLPPQSRQVSGRSCRAGPARRSARAGCSCTLEQSMHQGGHSELSHPISDSPRSIPRVPLAVPPGQTGSFVWDNPPSGWHPGIGRLHGPCRSGKR